KKINKIKKNCEKFLKIYKKEQNINCTNKANTESLYTDKKLNNKIYIDSTYTDKNAVSFANNISSIYSDNIVGNIFCESIDKNSLCNETICSNNTFKNIFLKLISKFIKSDKKINYEQKTLNENDSETIISNSQTNSSDFCNGKYAIKINAIDIDDTLVKLSPLFKYKHNRQKIKLTGVHAVDKYLKKTNLRIKNKYKYHKEVNYILLIKLLERIKDNYFDYDLKNILQDKKFGNYFDKEMVSFIKYYFYDRYKLSSCKYKLPFLHNIYYRYISRSYKNALQALSYMDFDFNCNFGDARDILKFDSNTYDFIFLDAFTPTKTPNLWTYDFFKLLYNKLNPDGILLTYSNSAAIRNALLKNGFHVGKIFNKSENKFTGTIASKNIDNIEYPLNDFDIGLITSKAGIVFRDENLNLPNEIIMKNREIEVANSSLISSTMYLKNYKEKHNEV
ncbi:hypothetical protein IJG72_08850, partial [bacterium]|nr:hypothetical protein [bacterium]